MPCMDPGPQITVRPPGCGSAPVHRIPGEGYFRCDEGENRAMKERITWADRARGLGILLIFSVHFFHMELGRAHLLVQLLSMSCLGTFYFTSGYFCSGRFALKPWLKHHAYTLLLPYLVASLAFWVIHFVQRDPGGFDRFLGIFLQLPDTPWEGGRWFIPSFFVAKLMFDFTASRCKDRYPAMWGICGGCAAAAWIYTLLDFPRLPWNLEAACFAQPFFALGFGWKRGWQQRYENLAAGKKAAVLFALTAAGLLLAVLNQNLGGRNMDYHTRELNEIFSAYGASCCSLFLILRISRVNSRLLEFIGRNSLTYCLYGALVSAVTSRIVNLLGCGHWTARYLIGLFGLALLGIPVCLVLNRYFPWAAGRRTREKR